MVAVNTPAVFDACLLGNLEADQRVAWWEHIKSLEPWQTHPIFQDDTVDLAYLIPVSLHGDGAQMKREDEHFVYSWASSFGHCGILKDILALKYPILILPERHMVSKKATWTGIQLEYFFV